MLLTNNESLPLVSIIMSTYNWSTYIRESIESVLSQDYTDREFIIINDASTDHVEDIILEYVAKDSRFVYIRNERNLHLTLSLNKGIEASQGKYIARIDDDDLRVWNTKLSSQVALLESDDTIWLCGTRVDFLYPDGSTKIATRYYTDSAIKSHFLEGNQIGHASILCRKAILEDIGYYNPRYNGYEDYELRMRLWMNYSIVNLKPLGMLYRQREWSIIQSNRVSRSWLFLTLTHKYKAVYWWYSLRKNIIRLAKSCLWVIPGLVTLLIYLRRRSQ